MPRLRPAAPLVSVITPTVGTRSGYLEQTLRSVWTQTLEDWEAIVVNDGPSRDCEAMVKKILGGKGVFIALPKPGGPAAARNAGIARARGEFIAFLDDDDLWLPRKLEKQMEFMIGSGARFSYTDYEIINEKGTRIVASWSKRGPAALALRARYPTLISMKETEALFKRLGFYSFPRLSTVMLGKNALVALGRPPFDESFRRTHEDTDLWLRLRAAWDGVSMAFYDEVLISNRVHPNQIIYSQARAEPAVRLDYHVLDLKAKTHYYCSADSHLSLICR